MALTLKALYKARTGRMDHQRRIDGHFRKLDARRREMVRRRLAGESLRAIGAGYGLSVGTVQRAIDRALDTIARQIDQRPRYAVSRKRAT